MGNKSRSSRVITENGKKVIAKWWQVKDRAAASLPPTRTPGWSGMKEKAISPKVGGMRIKLPVIYDSGMLGPMHWRYVPPTGRW